MKIFKCKRSKMRREAVQAVLFFAVMLVPSITCQYYTDACWSIGGRLGTCVPLGSCPLFSNWLRVRPLIKENIKTIVNYTCHFNITHPKVCCPNSAIFATQKVGESVGVRIGAPVRRGVDSAPASNNKLLFPSPSITFPSSVAGSSEEKEVKARESFPKTPRAHIPLSFPSDEHSERGKAIWGHGKGISSSPKKDLRHHPNFRLIPKMHECSNAAKLDSLLGTYGSYPWIALVGLKRRKSLDFDHVCGGVIINPRYILTAAHCFDRANPGYVRLGEYNLDTLIDQGSEFLPQSRREDFRIEKRTIHPDYNPVMRSHDIALLRVDKPIPLNTTFIRAACLPFVSEYGLGSRLDVHNLHALEGKSAWVAGWSRHSFDVIYSKGSESNVLQEGIAQFSSHDSCRHDHPQLSVLNSRNQLCVGGKGKRNSCVVDSGGPLMYPVSVPSRVAGFVEPKFFMLGLLSQGPTGKVCQNTGEGSDDEEGRSLPSSVYTKVSKYLDFILDNMQE